MLKIPGPQLDAVRYELLPFPSAEQQAAAVPRPLTLTVTCSPKHGNDHTIEVAGRLRALGHAVIVHVAARMVSGPGHVDSMLARIAEADLHEVFLIGGDRVDPMGPYRSSLDLLQVMRSHPDAPRLIGVSGYPEGHPLIADDVLFDDLCRKAELADYVTTQLCFHTHALVSWLERIRAAEVTLPVYVGLPGHVDRRRLLEISRSVGVGTSISYLRKQHGVGRLATQGASVAEELLRETEPLLGGELGVAGLHLFTFNQLTETVRSVERSLEQRSRTPVRNAALSHQEPRTT